MKRALAFLAGAAPLIAQAFPWDMRLEAERDNLDHGYADWKEALVQLAWKPEKSLAILGGARETERFDQRDHEIFAGAYLPLGSERTVLHVEGSASSSHNVLPRSVWVAEISQEIVKGWVVAAGYKASSYTTGDTETVLGTLDWYFGDYRLGYNLYLTRLEGASWAPSHRISASWYRSTLTNATVAGAFGREVENIFPTGLVTTDVRSFYVSGGIELTPQWGLTFWAGQERQGDLYTRRGARIGTRILF
jgi:YaiO family outer membrane protein